MKTPFWLLLLYTVIVWPQTALTPFQPQTPDQTQFAQSSDVYENEIICSAGNLSPVSQSRIFIFEKSDSTLGQSASFVPADGLPTDGFGSSVCIYGNFAAAGSPFHDSPAENAGAVYLYHKTGGTWQFFQKISATDAQPGDNFGKIVRTNGSQLFIGAPMHDESASPDDNNGAIYIYNLGPSVNFSQTIAYSYAKFLGNLIDANATSLAFYYYDPSLHDHVLESDTFSETGWIYESAIEFGDSFQDFANIRLDGNFFYIGIGTTNEPVPSQIFSFQKNISGWNYLASTPAYFEDNYLSDFDVSGSHMLVGLSNYFFQVTRKSPLLRYEKIGENWICQETIYGDGPAGADDRFGRNVTMSELLYVIGAPAEGSLGEGKGYYAEAQLSTPQFSSSSHVWPNPTDGRLSIENPNVSNIEIYSPAGQLLLTPNITAGSIDMAGLAAGIYFVRLYAADKSSVTHKIIRR
jgi:hypothetical protein